MNNLPFVGVPIVVVWALALRPLGEEWLRRWAARYGSPLDDVTRPFLRRRIRVARSIRATGFSAGIVVTALPLLTGDDGPTYNVPVVAVAWLAGTGVGVLAAELAAGRRPAGSVRRASLEVRRVGDYVEQWAVRLAAGAVAAAAAGVLVAATTGAEGDEVLAAVVLTVVGAAVLGLGLRAVPHRPLAGESSVRAADEALRAEGAYQVVGVAIALGAYGAAEAWGSVFGNPPAALLFALPAYPATGLWWALTHDTVWRVRRHATQPA